jgi:hypothetical protein
MSHDRTVCVVISAQLYIFFTINIITTLFFYRTFFAIILFCLANEKLSLSEANVYPEGTECCFLSDINIRFNGNEI